MKYKILEAHDGVVLLSKEELEEIMKDCYDEGYNVGLLADRPKEPSITDPPYNPLKVDPYGYPYYNYLDKITTETDPTKIKVTYDSQKVSRDDSVKDTTTENNYKHYWELEPKD